jgi:hypothetical protein
MFSLLASVAAVYEFVCVERVCCIILRWCSRFSPFAPHIVCTLSASVLHLCFVLFFVFFFAFLLFEMKRPRSSIDSVILYTTQDDSGNYIPTRYLVNSWVELNPGTRGKHAKDAAKRGQGTYKAQILQFRLSPGSTTVKKVLVQHAYMFRQLQLQPRADFLGGACNCKYLLISLFYAASDVDVVIANQR